MYVIIAGCRRVGSNLALELAQENHDVVVIDFDPSHLQALGSGFNGVTVVGMPIDEDVLRSAGIEQADALAAVTDDDNMNIMISQVAKEIFHVPCILTRLYDPKREAIMRSMGLTTVCPTNLAVDHIKSHILKQDMIGSLAIGNQAVTLRMIKPAHGHIGKELGGVRDEAVIGLIRNHALIPYQPHETIMTNDMLVIAVAESQEV